MSEGTPQITPQAIGLCRDPQKLREWHGEFLDRLDWMKAEAEAANMFRQKPNFPCSEMGRIGHMLRKIETRIVALGEEPIMTRSLKRKRRFDDLTAEVARLEAENAALREKLGMAERKAA